MGENPDILVFRGARGLIGNEAGEITIELSNPGVLAGVLTKIDYQGNDKVDPEMIWNWQSLHPILTPRPNEVVHQFRSCLEVSLPYSQRPRLTLCRRMPVSI